MADEKSTFLDAPPTQAWLAQFDPRDQPSAAEMLRAMALVSHETFANGLRALLLHRLAIGSQPVGLYVERELPRYKGRPKRLFKETRTKVRRAYGVGPQPVQPTRAYDPDVGSEGFRSRSSTSCPFLTQP